MKLASLKSPHAHNRDGTLCVVSRDLQWAAIVDAIAPTLQYALDNWAETEPELQAIFDALNAKRLPKAFPFDETNVHAPLPRAYQWADGSAYVHHVELVRKARGATMPEQFWTEPLMYQGGSDSFLGAHDPICARSEEDGIDFEGEIAVITGDVPMGTTDAEAGAYIRLLMLANDVSLRNLIPEELAKGFGFFQSKPASSFSPVAVTPSELGSSWDGKCVHLPLAIYLNNTLFGAPNAGKDMVFSFPRLIAHAAATRHLCAGTIIGSGTISNKDPMSGSACIVEKRMLEILNTGAPQTPFMKFGDLIRMEMHDLENQSIFGTISQEVVCYPREAIT